MVAAQSTIRCENQNHTKIRRACFFFLDSNGNPNDSNQFMYQQGYTQKKALIAVRYDCRYPYENTSSSLVMKLIRRVLGAFGGHLVRPRNKV